MALTNDILIGVALIIFSISITSSSAKNFRGEDDAGLNIREEAEASVMKELSGTFRPGATQDNIFKLEAQLQPIFAAMPQEEDGTLNHAVVRYVLYRFFVQRGWYVRGLEPSASMIYSSTGNTSLKGIHEWVPSFLQAFLEQLHGGRGTSLRELAVLAATLEDLIHKETNYYTQKTLYLVGLGFKKQFDDAQIREVLEAYTINYLAERQSTRSPFVYSRGDRENYKAALGDQWPKVSALLDSVHQQIASQGIVDAKVLTKMVEIVGEHYYVVKEGECAQIKSDLLEIESKKVGRVRLTEFYKRGLAEHSVGKFNEKLGYLKALGAIDESDPTNPLVIVPNYVASRANCLAASGFYGSCCKNQCEDLMEKIEREAKGEFATPEKLLKMVSSFSTDTVHAPRQLSDALSQRLRSIARANTGIVPLHGRLFAQWMHHVFPRECPLPYAEGSINPTTPEAWMEEASQTEWKHSQDDLAEHLDQHGAANDFHPIGDEARKHHDLEENMLSWTDAEELLDPVNPERSPRVQFQQIIRRVVIIVTLCSISLFAKRALFSSTSDSNVKFIV